MFNLILFGPPGSGKGTQSEKLIAKYHFRHLSTGDLLRSEISRKTPLGIEAKKFMDKGNLVPDEVVIGMINDMLDMNMEAVGFLFDGFPRTAIQAQELDNLLAGKHTCIDVMIALEVSEELIKRLLKRGETSGRTDDNNEQVIRARIAEYHKKTATVADHYQKAHKVVMIKGEGTVDEIFARLSGEIDHLMKLDNC
jgi:adenylate kinase